MEPVLVSELLAPHGPPPVYRPVDVGGPAAWFDLLRRGALRAVTDEVSVPALRRVTPQVRARAIASRVPAGHVVCDASAVWVHCGGRPPARLDVARRAGTRRLASDSAEIGGVLVTTPVRTAVDVAARLETEQAVELLLALAAAGTDLAAVGRRLEGRARVVGRPAARVALDAARRLAAGGAGA
ncbi:hypothetical protein ET495_05120 [Xylanimonas allomyrinae]|uniref:AbiEi antitoxin C-terminal domain-containing protein n=1 Tax=Xylanimonas allomyrinae TaxID=2509459 RepID=A0A4P6EJE6_9MICO|nr:hypothetical protein [Xylanimonas allomyrinae]QAY62740.1 hypothetical protein ET495_05120 [Xylanimonas allomyrinae]